MTASGFQIFFKNFAWILLLLIICTDVSSAQDSLLNKNISISFNRSSINDALGYLQKASQLSLAFDPDIIPDKKVAVRNFEQQKVEDVLKYILNNTNLTYKEVANSIVIMRNAILLHTLNGIIYDEETGENLISATLQINGAVEFSNQYGYYSISIPSNKYTLAVSYIGYETNNQTIILKKDNYISIGLKRKPLQLQEIVIATQGSGSDSTEIVKSVKSIPLSQLKRMPYYAGEADVIKALQMQSGIKNSSEGSSGLSVRGGNLDQNLILVDEAPVYNPSHLFGLISIFNIDAVKSIQLYKDYIPANFGGRLSSVIDIKLDEGNINNFHIKGGTSLLSSRFAAEGPIIKDKSSYLFSFRRSLTDLYNNEFRFFNINANYYDFNLKSNYILSKKNRIYYSIYHGFDRLFSNNNYANNWSNSTSTLRFNHIFNPRLFLNISAIYSNYIHSLDITSLAINNKEWLTGIRDIGLKGDFTFYKNQGNTIQFGVAGTRHHIKPGETADYTSDFSLNRFRAEEYSLYYNQDIKINARISLNYGLRTGVFLVDEENKSKGIEKDNTFYNFEPRLQFRYYLNKDQLLKFSYMRNDQNLQLVKNSELSYSSIETWIPANSKIKPQKADVYSSAYTWLTNPKMSFEFSLYYKKMYNQVDIADHSQIFLNPLLQNDFRFGEGTAYGLEITFAKKMEKFAGEINYSYSRTFRKIKEINSGSKYPATYDLPNDLKLSLSYHLNKRIAFSTFFNYSNGRPVTLPVGFYADNGSKIPIYEGRNSSRFPDFSRWDIVAELKPKTKKNDPEKKRWLSTWSFGIYNVYGRRNPLFYRVTEIESPRDIGFEESFSGIIPALSYSFKY